MTCQFVHFDVFSVELNTAHAISNVGLPAHEVRAKIVHEHGVKKRSNTPTGCTVRLTISRRHCRNPQLQHALGRCTSSQRPRTSNPGQPTHP